MKFSVLNNSHSLLLVRNSIVSRCKVIEKTRGTAGAKRRQKSPLVEFLVRSFPTHGSSDPFLLLKIS